MFKGKLAHREHLVGPVRGTTSKSRKFKICPEVENCKETGFLLILILQFAGL